MEGRNNFNSCVQQLRSKRTGQKFAVQGYSGIKWCGLAHVTLVCPACRLPTKLFLFGFWRPTQTDLGRDIINASLV